MRIDEITRRGFLKGALGAVVGGVPLLSRAAPWQELETYRETNPIEYERVWVPRITELQGRCNNILSKIYSVLAKMPKWSKFAKTTPVKIIVDALSENMNAVVGSDRAIYVDVSVFWDAPDSVLVFVLAHELGHIVLKHPESNASPALSRKQEYEADLFAIQLCKSMGFNSSQFFTFVNNIKTKSDRIEKQLRDEEAESDSTASHPSDRQRMERAKKYKFHLSRGGIEQLNTLSQHLYRATQSA